MPHFINKRTIEYKAEVNTKVTKKLLSQFCEYVTVKWTSV
jgi:hypothetical protein